MNLTCKSRGLKLTVLNYLMFNRAHLCYIQAFLQQSTTYTILHPTEKPSGFNVFSIKAIHVEQGSFFWTI